MEPRDPCGLFEHLTSLDRLGRDHVRDLALADQRGGMCAGRSVGEGERDILRAHVVAVDPVGTARAAFDPADHLQLFAAIVGAGQHHLGELARRALLGPGEDDVFHPARAHRLGRGFPHDPADRFEQVGLAASVGADHAGQPRFYAQFGRLYEALETREAKAPYLHPRALLRPQRAPARCKAASTDSQLPPSSWVPLMMKVGVPRISSCVP